MGWLEFIANVIESLAWPAAIAIAVVLLRKQLRGLIARLRKASYRGAEVELFGEAVEEAEKVAVGAALPPEQEHLIVGVTPDAGPPRIAREALVTTLAPVIDAAPRAAVMEAYQAVEEELDAVARDAGLLDPSDQPGRRPALILANQLVNRGVIEPALGSVIADLRKARNVAAHERPYAVERDEVVEYVKLAGRVRAALRLAREQQAAAMEGRTAYDLLVYHDLSDPTPTTGGRIPSVGDRADEWFGEEIGRDRYVAAVGPGIHEGRVTVVLSHGRWPMPEVQALLNRPPED